MKYKAVIFDVGDTLLEYFRSQKQIYVERLKYLGFDINADMERKIADVILKSSNEQIIKEQNGAPRMPDEEFETIVHG